MPASTGSPLLSKITKEVRMRIALKDIHTIFGLCIASLMAVVSCEPASEVKPLPPNVELGSALVEATGGPQFVHVKSSVSWELSIVSEYDGTVDWITVDQTSGDKDCDVEMKVAANDTEDERSATITVVSKAGEASAKLTQKGKESVKPDPGPKPDPEPKPSVTGWLELPAVPDGTAFFTHPMTVGSTKTRNYSFIWDYNNLVAPWVAYPLCKWNIGNNIKRTNAWGLDPLLPEGKQPVLFKGFSEGNNGWYARGHQIPSADRLTSYNSNAMTFYGTNMTPQIQEGFNGDIWATLEVKVRSWANSSDTLYVVTGCVIDYPEGQTVKYALDNYGKKVTVPTAYYKVVLRYLKNSTIGYSGYAACAVWLDHKVYSSSSINSSYSMSVDDLEKKTGIDFFVNLPAKVGEETAAKIEAEDPAKVSWWW